MAKPIMARATAVWLIDNTTLTFKQIGDFVEMHELEIQGIADGDVDENVRGFDPIANNQLEKAEIERGEANPAYRLKLRLYAAAVGEKKRQGPRYMPLSKRKERPAAIYWLVKFHPELSDGQISKLVGTTKPTIMSIRDRSHWDISNIQPVDPVALGFCKQLEIDAAVQKATAKRLAQAKDNEEDGEKLLSNTQSLGVDGADSADIAPETSNSQTRVDADSFFNIEKAPESNENKSMADALAALEKMDKTSNTDAEDE